MKPLEFHRTGLHNYVSRLVENGRAAHMPIKTCWYMAKAPESLESLAARVEGIDGQVSEIQGTLSKLESKLEGKFGSKLKP